MVSSEKSGVTSRLLAMERPGGFLWSDEAADLKAEEGVGVGAHADLGVRGAGLSASKTFIVDADVQGLNRADLGVKDVRHRDRIEERGRLLAPLVVEEGQGIC